MKIDILGFQAFLSIADKGNFQRAAAALNLSQTALSHRIRKFEEDLGVQLLSRTTRKVALTRVGLDLVPKARRILDDIAGSIEELREVGRRQQDTVAIGCLPTMAANLLPRILREFTDKHPPITIKIFDKIAPEITELVQSGMAEVAFTVSSATGPDLEFQPLVKQQFVVLCPAGHRLSRKAAISASDLEGTPLIRLGPHDAARILIDETFGSRGHSLTWDYEVQQATTAISLVSAGIGLTIVPRLALGLDHVGDVVIVPLTNPRITSTLGLLSKRNVPLSPAAEALVGIIRRHVQQGSQQSAQLDGRSTQSGSSQENS